MAKYEEENRKRIADYYKDQTDRATRKTQTPSEKRLANANLAQSDEDIAPNFKSKRARSDGSLQVSVDAPKKQSFGDAFKSAKKDGKGTFTYNGKSYTTETAEEKAKKSKPTPTGNIGSRTMMEEGETAPSYKKGGKVKSYAKGGGCELKGKTKGRFV